ncbi:uncharacterized protein LOC107044082 [Diachasma alloeum]|uniref:uncharacterized protein LOC107044082 n=1 Tax=Diachasma alloeum TaxID=454923 RepID=UPI0007383961|nr:uncharacterized protein LOC107044082 [Diachasma alloeum]
MNCPEDFYYSEVDRGCTFQSDAKCKTFEQSDETTVALSRFIYDSNNHCMGTCPCTNSPQLTVTLEHQDCGKFCKCMNGVAYEYDCPAGFHFSPVLGVCTYPEKANGARCSTPIPDACPPHGWGSCCTSTVTVIATVTTTVKPSAVTITPSPVTIIPTTVTVTVTLPCSTPGPDHGPVTVTPPCPTPGPDPVLAGCIGTCPIQDPKYAVHLAHSHCSKFCKCSHGVPTLIPCPPGLYFNPELEVCDWPQQANCKGIRDKLHVSI